MVLEECSICGVSGTSERLMEAISLKGKGIVAVCGSCLKREGMPLLKRPTTFQLKEAERNPVARRNVLSRVSSFPRDEEGDKTEANLRTIVDKNYEKLNSVEKKPRPDLVEHFHWIIMRARRRRKLTQEQLARDISEATAAIRMAEDGILPEDDYRLISKLESFLDVRLIKNRGQLSISGEKKQPSRIINFDAQAMQNLTIDDLKRMKQEREDSSISMPTTFSEGEVLEDIEDNSPSVFSSGDLKDER